MDKKEFQNLRRKIAFLEKDLASAKSDLVRLEGTCHHVWSEPVYAPIEHPGYTANTGFSPGYGGSDAWMFMPYRVPATKEDRWERTCQRCERKEVTTGSKQVSITSKKPVF